MMTDFDHERFDWKVEHEGDPSTFGPAEPIYDQMLNTSEFRQRLSSGRPTIALVGSTYYSGREFIAYIRRMNPNSHIVIVDISNTPLTQLGDQLQSNQDVKLLQSDGRKLPLTSGSIDAVFTNFLLHHIVGTQLELLKESHRVLKSEGGLFLLEFENYRELVSQARYKDIITFSGEGMTREEYWGAVDFAPGSRISQMKTGGEAIFAKK